jgi:hypothetical protein
MEEFGKVAVNRVALNPTYRFHYMDDTFMIWPHGPKELKILLNHIQFSILFTKMMKSNSHLPFLDIDIYRRPVGSLGHMVYRKPTHTSFYLNAESHHHLTNKHFMFSTLVLIARAIMTRKVSQENWISFIVCSSRMSTLTGRFTMLSLHLAGRTHLLGNLHQWPLTLCSIYIQLLQQGVNKTQHKNCQPPL